MRVLLWTKQAQADRAAIRAFIGQDSPHYATVVITRLIAATDRLVLFPESGRTGADALLLFRDPALLLTCVSGMVAAVAAVRRKRPQRTTRQ